jgi:hypothetical protein
VGELSSYVFLPLRGGDSILHRGTGEGLTPVLLAAAAAQGHCRMLRGVYCKAERGRSGPASYRVTAMESTTFTAPGTC